MSLLAIHGAKPAHVVADEHFGPWFGELADDLLNGVDFLVAGRPYRFAEIEAYYFGAGHPDIFAHRHPVQLQTGRWYFHRTGGGYRGGSYKGLDLTFGDGTATFGVLVRTIVDLEGRLVDGPSLTVDHLLAQTGTATPAVLDASTAARSAWDTSSPLALRTAIVRRLAPILRTARVGLSMKRGLGNPAAAQFIARPYRFLTEPRRIAKGKPHAVLALHQEGKSAEAIRRLTGVSEKAIARYVAAYEEGRRVPNFEGYCGRNLNSVDVCRLIGTWAATFGAA